MSSTYMPISLDEMEPNRLALEMAVEAAASKIKVSKPDLAWLDDPEWDEFLKAYDALADYYQSGQDTVISPVSFKAFKDFAWLLTKALIFREIDEKRLEQAEDELIALNGVMDNIILETVMNLRSSHPELDI